MNSNFFKSTLTDKSLIPTWWVTNLDWIFDDEKFEKTLGWTKGPRRTLTNYIKKNVSNISVIKKGDEILAPKEGAYAIFTSDECVCVSFMRHIRNSIAHSNATIVTSKKPKYIRFKDYSNNTRKIQTADIMISMDLLMGIQQKYASLKNIPEKYLPQDSKENSKAA